MESFEFLGGRYNRPEQIMSGPMQAFRAQSAATGRAVFIHRVSTAEAPEEQASLLKLLTTALVKSSDAKRLVLDFGEERGYWYVVTESEPQCALLREWLQLEVDAAAVSARLGLPADSSPAATSKPAPAPVAAPSQPATESGEFTRFIQTRAPFSQSLPAPRFTPPTPPPASAATSLPPAPVPPAPTEPAGAGDFTRVFQNNLPAPNAPPPPAPVATPPSVQPAVQRSTPGEFTSFFNQPGAERKSLPQDKAESGSGAKAGAEFTPPKFTPTGPAPTQKPSPDQPASGEFTRFFQDALPPAAAKAPPNPPVVNPSEQSLNRPLVQRPNTPVPPAVSGASAKPPDNGEFTKLFSRPPDAPPVLRPKPSSYQPPAQASSDPFNFSKETASPSNDLVDDIFSNRIDIPQPIPSSQPQKGEFTRMFGEGGDAPPPVQRPAVTAAPPVNSPVNDDRTSIMQPSPARPAPSADSGAGPGEFTRILQGGYGPAKPPAAGAPGPAATPGLPATPPVKGGSTVPLPKVNIQPVNVASVLPHLGSHGASAGSAHASAGPSSASASSALGSASISAPKLAVPPAKIPTPAMGGANKKMIVLFSVLGVLAVVLVLLMLFLMKK